MKLYFFSTCNVLFSSLNTTYYYLLITLIIEILTYLSIIVYKNFIKKDYFIIFINLLCELLFNYFLFCTDNSLFLFSIKLIQFIFSIHLNEIIYLNKKSANLFMPYIIWNYILTLLTIISLFLNVSI